MKRTKLNYLRAGTVQDVDSFFNKISLNLFKPYSKMRQLPEYHIYVLGHCIKRYSDRYKVFKKSKTCVSCNIEGKFLALERGFNSSNSIIKTFHLNLYALDEYGKEVLMTKDHIIPKSKGGKDILENYQTMCSKCNTLKGNS